MNRKTIKRYSLGFISLVIMILLLNESFIHSPFIDKLLDYVVSPILIGVIFFMLDTLRPDKPA